MTVTTTKAEMGGMMGNRPIPTPKAIHESGVLDSRNRFQASQADNAIVSSFMGMGGGASQSAGLMIELPDHPVKVGDSWGMDVAGLSQIGAGNHKLTITPARSGTGERSLRLESQALRPYADLHGHEQDAWRRRIGRRPTKRLCRADGEHVDDDGRIDGLLRLRRGGPKDGKTAKIDYSVASDLTMHMTPKQGGTQPMTIKVAGTSTCALRLANY